MAIRIGDFTSNDSFRCFQSVEIAPFDKMASQALFIAEIASHVKIVDQIDPSNTEDRANVPTFAPRRYELSEAESRAMSMSFNQIYGAVVPHGEWDFKRNGRSELEDFGNWNFGVVGKAWATQYPLSDFLDDIYENAAERAAGWAQEFKTQTSDPAWGHFWGSSPYGDDPADQSEIDNGWATERDRLETPLLDISSQEEGGSFEENPQDYQQPDDNP